MVEQEWTRKGTKVYRRGHSFADCSTGDEASSMLTRLQILSDDHRRDVEKKDEEIGLAAEIMLGNTLRIIALEAKLREAETKATLFDLVMDALDEYEPYGSNYSSWTIEVPTTSTDGKTTYSRQYLANWHADYRALQQPKAGT